MKVGGAGSSLSTGIVNLRAPTQRQVLGEPLHQRAIVVRLGKGDGMGMHVLQQIVAMRAVRLC